MVERTPDPKSRDYKLKDVLIAQLGSGDLSFAPALLSELGVIFDSSTVLSRKQKANFLASLTSSGLLVYNATCLANVVYAASRRDPDKLLGKVEDTLDRVAWNIEEDAGLQVQAVVAARKLLEVEPTLGELVVITSRLFDAAHLATRKESYVLSADDIGGSYRISLSRFYAVEQAVFEQRASLGSELIGQDLASLEAIEDLNGMDFDAYRKLRRYSELFDQLIALYFVRQFSATDCVGRFKELQGVLHTVYSMGIRDAIEANARLAGID